MFTKLIVFLQQDWSQTHSPTKQHCWLMLLGDERSQPRLRAMTGKNLLLHLTSWQPEKWATFNVFSYKNRVINPKYEHAYHHNSYHIQICEQEENWAYYSWWRLTKKQQLPAIPKTNSSCIVEDQTERRLIHDKFEPPIPESSLHHIHKSSTILHIRVLSFEVLHKLKLHSYNPLKK